MMDISARSLKIKRDVISKLLDEGLYPYTKRYLGTFANHFSTIGMIGMNEVGLNAKWLRKDLTHVETQDFAKEVLNHMRDRLVMYQEEYGDLYNLEATPAESTTYRLAKHDKEQYPDIITAGEPGDTPYYTNSSHLPVGYTADIFDALDIQDGLQTLYTSGTVFHAFLGEKLPDWKAAAALVRKIAENYSLPYYTLSPTYSVCKEHGYLAGEHFTCPISCMKKVKTSLVTVRKEDVEIKPVESVKYLFTTKTCPNCKIAKEILKGEDYQIIDAEENQDLVRKYGIMQAPTLVVTDGTKAKKYVNASNIKKYVADVKQTV